MTKTRRFLATCAVGVACLGGCGTPPQSPAPTAAPAAPGAGAASAPVRIAAGPPRYRCDQGIEFTVRFTDDTAVLDGSRGNEVLLRDAGGATPQQTVYSNLRMRAEFGLGANGREAILRYAQPPLAAHCTQD